MSTSMMALMGRIIVGMGVVGATATYVAVAIDQQGVVTGILYIDKKYQLKWRRPVWRVHLLLLMVRFSDRERPYIRQKLLG